MKITRDNIRNVDLRGQEITGDFNGSDLSDLDFRGCRINADFSFCDLTESNFEGAKINSKKWVNTSARRANFNKIYITGSEFAHCDFSNSKFKFAEIDVNVTFRACYLNHVNMYRIDAPRVAFISCSMRKANLKRANLNQAFIQQSLLINAKFDKTSLINAVCQLTTFKGCNFKKADVSGMKLSESFLKGAVIPDDIPVIPDIHVTLEKAISKSDDGLEMGSWHGKCGTTHCRAGWVTFLIGKPDLEADYSAETLAALVYQKSDPSLEQIPDFFSSNDDAMKSIQDAAAEQREKND